jgi:hypothetical protein
MELVFEVVHASQSLPWRQNSVRVESAFQLQVNALRRGLSRRQSTTSTLSYSFLVVVTITR